MGDAEKKKKSIIAKIRNLATLMKMHLPEIDLERGVLLQCKHRHFILPMEVLVGIEDATKQYYGQRTPELLYEAGKIGGRIEGMIGIEQVGRDLDKFIDYCIISASASGWGRHEVISIDKDAFTAIIRVYNALTPELIKSDDPVCNLHLGFVTGIIEEFFHVEMVGRETKCKGKGDEYCEFYIAPSDDVDEKTISVMRGLF